MKKRAHNMPEAESEAYTEPSCHRTPQFPGLKRPRKKSKSLPQGLRPLMKKRALVSELKLRPPKNQPFPQTVKPFPIAGLTARLRAPSLRKASTETRAA